MNLLPIITKIGVRLLKHAPTILTALGIGCSVGAAVVAVKKSPKAKEVEEEKQAELQKLEETVVEEEQNTKEYKKSVRKIKNSALIKKAKVYLPAIALEGVSAGCLVCANRIMFARVATLTSTLAGTTLAFSQYRKRVIDKYGKDEDLALSTGCEFKTVTEIDADTGETKEKKIPMINKEARSQYAIFYDCGNSQWVKDPQANLYFLRVRQDEANQLLKSQGFVFLNDVYDMLGAPKTKAGQIVGWRYVPEDKNRDNYIDFGLKDSIIADNFDAYGIPIEPTFYLDFNVDGPIIDEI